MVSDNIRANYRIISSKDLIDILDFLNSTYTEYQQNNSNVTFTITAYFSDDTNMVYKTYDTFRHSFYNRIKEIIKINANFKYKNDTIDIFAHKDLFEAGFSFNLENSSIERVYNYIKNKVLYSPDKYDDVTMNKFLVKRTIILSRGLLPSILLGLILLLIPKVNMIVFKGILVYPLFVLIMTLLIGLILDGGRIRRYYKTLHTKNKKQDQNGFTSEVQIGVYTDNSYNRNCIREYYEKYQHSLPLKIIVLLTINIIIVFIGYFVLI